MKGNMPSLREKAAAAGFGTRSPSWQGAGLGRADRSPESIVSGLGLSRFMGRGDDWMQDVHNLLVTAQRSVYLRDLYSEPRIFRQQGVVMINAASDLYGYSPAVMRRMIMSSLWAAELTGRIALPTRVSVDITPDQRGVMISIK
jgi:hypothetical protein